MVALTSTPVAVVIPAYKVKAHILAVLATIGSDIKAIYVVDDACPEQSGDYVQKHCQDPRVEVLYHQTNQGVGGAMLTGYKKAAQDGMQIIVKIDGDGQMDPQLATHFVRPILEGQADYTKGNRFYHPEDARRMPLIRLIGNGLLSVVTKFSSGYWNIVDPTNGYTAIHVKMLSLLPLEKIHTRYFFESDMLFRLNTLRAVVMDIPMKAVYGNEESNLHIRHVWKMFLGGNIRNFCKRIFYNYFLRDVSAATLELIFAAFFIPFGIVFGTCAWMKSVETGIPASSGTVMIAALPLILGFQMLLSFLAYDVQNIPTQPVHKKL